MATAVTKFEEASVPAFLRAPDASVTNALAALGSASFPYLSIKGKRFAVVRNKEETIIMRPDDDDTPANAIEIVIVSSAINYSKVYYKDGYTEGSKDKPTCFSNDGQAPDPQAADKQSRKCAPCEHNVWGSGNNGKGKACSDSLRMAVSAPGSLNDPMMIRVPPASLKNATEYAAMLARKGAPLEGLITKIKFDAAEATPKLVFSPVSYLTEAQYAEVLEIAKTNVVQQIVGAASMPMLANKAGPVGDAVKEEEDKQEAEAKERIAEEDAARASKAAEKLAKTAKPAKAAKPAKEAAPASGSVSALAAKLKASMGAASDD